MQSVEQLRDRLAELMGWTQKLGFYSTTAGPRMHKWHKGSDEQFDHPVTLSLDWLVAHGLPKGWEYRAMFFHTIAIQDCPVCCMVGKGSTNRDVFAPTELHARLSACVAAWFAQAERSGT